MLKFVKIMVEQQERTFVLCDCYSIHEFSQILNVSAQILRNWDKIGNSSKSYNSERVLLLLSRTIIIKQSQKKDSGVEEG